MLILTVQELDSMDRVRAALDAEIAGDVGEVRDVWLCWRAALDELRGPRGRCPSRRRRDRQGRLVSDQPPDTSAFQVTPEGVRGFERAALRILRHQPPQPALANP